MYVGPSFSSGNQTTGEERNGRKNERYAARRA
jgi:hypothetical protein